MIMSGSQYLSWNDAHFCGLRSQTNVYSLSKNVSTNNKIKLLAASIDGHLASVKFELQSSSSDPIIVPVSNDDVIFNSALGASNTETEGETEIASIDVVGNWDHQGKNILVVTYLKLGRYDEDKAPQAFMNIYHLPDEDDDSITFDASRSLLQNLNLDFIPFRLTHHKIFVGELQENFLLLGGGDHKIHTYKPTEGYKGFQEVATSKYFPELVGTDDCVTQLEIKRLDAVCRLTSFGTQNGLVCLFLVNEHNNEIQYSWTSEMDSPITSLHLFHQHTNIPCPDFIKSCDNDSQSKDGEGEEAWNLLVTSAVDPATVYYDVVSNGLNKCRLLPVSNSQDVILCSCVMDVDFDGENEVLIGTYGKVLLVYKLMYEKPEVYSSTPFHSPTPIPIHTDTPILYSNVTENKPVSTGGRRDSSECQDKDVRRRHKTAAATISTECENSLLFDRHDKHRSEDFCLPDGTSQQALMLRLVRSQENLASPSARSIQFDTPDLTVPYFAAMAPGIDYPCYKLLWTRHFCNPVMGLSCDDVTRDGMQDLVVLTLKGLHVLQPDPQEVSTIILNRLQALCNSENEQALPSQKYVVED